MNSRQMQEAVEIELRQRDKDYEVKNKLESKEIFYFLSKAEKNIIQEIYDEGIDKKEENKKKLGKLLKTATISDSDYVVSNSFYPSAYSVSLPDDVWYVLNDRATTSEDSDIYVKPISFDEYNTNKENPFRKPRTDKYLRLEGLDEHIILTPNTTLISLKIDYIKTPVGINVNQNCELHDMMHYNVVNSAVKLILGAKQEQVGYQIQSMEENKNK